MIRRTFTQPSDGFTILELVVAMAIVGACMASALSLVVAGQRIALRQPEVADQQQRARTVSQALAAELQRAGAGLDRGVRAGPLAQYFAPVAVSPDGGLTIWYVAGRGQGALAEPLEASAPFASIASAGICPVSQPACGFEAPATAILFGPSGCHDAARVEEVLDAVLILRAATRGCRYNAGSPIATGEVRTYRVDPASQQLVRRDEATGLTQPVMDRVSAMSVDVIDGGRRIRLTLRFASAMFQVPDFTIALDAAPPNIQGG